MFRPAVASVFVGLTFASNLLADELRWTHYGVRPLAMGNAFVAVADDFNALFYNPAGLARLTEWDGELINPSVEVSKNTMDFFSDLSTFLNEGKSSNDEVLDFLEDQTGKVQHFGLMLTPHLVFENFGFGVGLEMVGNLNIHREVAADVEIGPRVIIPISVAWDFFENRLSVGGSIKPVVRGGIDREFDIQTIEAFTSEDGSSSETKLDDFVEGGYGVGADVGILFTPTKTMEPTLGVSVTDLGGTPYSQELDVGGESLGTPDLRLPSVNVGTSLKPFTQGPMYVLTAVDMHAINQPISFSKKLNVGAEWGYKKIIKLGVGLHQGYLTSGLQFDVGLFNLRLATYAAELAPVAGSSDETMDRRYVAQVKLLL